MFECIDDRQAAHALLDAAAGWLRARGRNEIRGPIDYSINYPCGLLIDGFDTPPRVMMNHNRIYYAGLLESWGLTKVRDLYAWWFVDQINLTDSWRHRVERIVERSGITIRHFDNNNFDAEVARCREVYNSAMRDLLGIRQTHRRRIPASCRAPAEDRPGRTSVAGGTRRKADRLFRNPARH